MGVSSAQLMGSGVYHKASQLPRRLLMAAGRRIFQTHSAPRSPHLTNGHFAPTVLCYNPRPRRWKPNHNSGRKPKRKFPPQLLLQQHLLPQIYSLNPFLMHCPRFTSISTSTATVHPAPAPMRAAKSELQLRPASSTWLCRMEAKPSARCGVPGEKRNLLCIIPWHQSEDKINSRSTRRFVS